MGEEYERQNDHLHCNTVFYTAGRIESFDLCKYIDIRIGIESVYPYHRRVSYGLEYVVLYVHLSFVLCLQSSCRDQPVSVFVIITVSGDERVDSHKMRGVNYMVVSKIYAYMG